MEVKKRTNLRVVSWLIATIMIAMLITMMSPTSYAASRTITGWTLVGQAIYTGPSTSLYTQIGSLNGGSQVYILGKENGWYHILYEVGGQEAANAYIPQNTVTLIRGGTPHEEVFTGGQRNISLSYAQESWTCDELSTRVKLRNLVPGQGMTLLYEYSHNTYPIAFVEYSTPWGAERGYIFLPVTQIPNPAVTAIARVNIPIASVFFGPGGSQYYDFQGSVFEDELVTLIRESQGWSWIEYNTPSGRKRGYTMSGNITAITSTYGLEAISQNNTGGYVSSPVTVYVGPNSSYPSIYTLFTGDNLTYRGSQNGLGAPGWYYIEFTDRYTGKGKKGFLVAQ